MMIEADAGYYFGYGVFETIALEEGNPIFLEDHLERLRQGMETLGLLVDWSMLMQQLTAKLASDEAKHGRQALKVAVSEKNITLSLRPNPYKPFEPRGLVAAISAIKRNETSPFVGCKTFHLGELLWEKQRMQKEGIDEPIFFNTQGFLSEGAVSNVFFIKEGRLHTPALDCGLLPGTIRQYLCQHWPIEEGYYTPEMLLECEGMFVTNALMGIMPVRRLQGKDLPIPAQINELAKAYQVAIGQR